MSRLLRTLGEKIAEAFYEGPEPPSRLAEQVAAFGVMNPGATREQWAEFAARLAAGAYRDGFTRGFDWQARSLDRLPPEAPEREAEERAQNFAWSSPGYLTSDQLAERVEGDFYEGLPSEEAKARYLDALGRYQGSYRLVVLPPGQRLPGPPEGR